MSAPFVAIVMGSDSDLPVMQACFDVLKSFGIPFEARITSAHRTPEVTKAFVQDADERGCAVFIAAAGMAAHLAGAVSATTVKPVIGVPMNASLDGLDALLSTVQMPAGIPVASVAIAAHELGHALQDNEGYYPLKIRSALVPAVNIGSTLGWIFIIIGLFMQWSGLAWLGVIVFSAGALFSLATLPVELNASARAKELLVQSGIIVGNEERKGVNKVLNAAAFTYVAALLTSIMQLLYFTSLVGGMGGRRR